MDQITIPLSDDELDWPDDFLLYRVEEDEAEAGARTKGVSFALLLEKPCHVAHALN